MRCAYVTYSAWNDPSIDPDTDLLPALAALRAHFSAEVAVWNDPRVDWSSFDVALVRSVWDYVPQRDAFLSWADEASKHTQFINPASVFAKNSEKSYLRDIEAKGAPIVPSSWIHSAVDVQPSIERWAGNRMVVKPCIGAGAWDTILTDDPSVAAEHARGLLASGRSSVVQPYLASVDGEGEVSVVCLEGEPVWAVRKVPALTEGGRGDADAPVPLTAELTEAAIRVLAAEPLTAECLWARVDLVRGGDGALVLMELELTEPMLFLATVAGSAERLASSVANWTKR